MTDFPPRDPNETQQFSSPGGAAPPHMTAPIYMPRPPSRGRGALLIILALLIGAAGGYGASQVLGQRSTKLPDESLVLYENASSTFPIEGAAFTASTYNAASKQCDKELLKQQLRADPRRFKAWVDLEQITEGDFDSFVDRLQSQLLTKATPVTDHGCFPDGAGDCPFAIQSVLGPGTPVWFDGQQQRSVAKCMSSSPVNDPQCPPNCEDIAVATPTEPATEPPTAQPTATPSATPSPTASIGPSPTLFPTLTPEPTVTKTPRPKRSPSPTP